MRKTFMTVAAALATSAIMAQESNIRTIDLGGTEVTGTRAPMPADKAVRLVQVIDRTTIEGMSAHSVNDLLKMVAGVDVRQRGGFGIQTDIGVNGGTEDQLTVLLNGINISNPHTGHLTMDLPVSPDDIERIEVIEGGASRVYGSQAFAGAINIVTRQEKKSQVGAHVSGGSYGTLGANASVNLLTGALSNRLSGGYSRSDGGTYNDDFNKAHGYWNGSWSSQHFTANVQAGASTMNYGANTFYGTGSTSQYEEDRRYLVAASGEYRSKAVNVPAQIYWNRSLDHYVWWRDRPEDYQNFHQTNVYGANVGANKAWALGRSAVGVELRRENILSTRLGKELSEGEQYKHKVPGHDAYYKYKDGRTNVGIYAEHNFIVDNVTLSLGVLANHNTSVEGGMRFYPGVDLSWRMGEVKLFASLNQSLRTPTYTDLYYNGPGLQGNSQLKPEKSTDWHLGMSYTGNVVSAQVKGFYRKGTDMIDWVKYEGAEVYSTANSDIDNIGTEVLVATDLRKVWSGQSVLHGLTIGYCYNYKHRVDEEQAASYASRMTFLRHKLTASLSHQIAGNLTAQWDFALKNREGEFDNVKTGQTQTYGTFATLDVKMQWKQPHYSIYVQGNNITGRKYYDFANIQQPGMWLMGGVKMNLDL